MASRKSENGLLAEIEPEKFDFAQAKYSLDEYCGHSNGEERKHNALSFQKWQRSYSTYSRQEIDF